MVSKYVGETEKNLVHVLDWAAAEGRILLLDEADALFDKRTHVRNAHDHCANQNLSYLSQRLK